MEKNPRQETNQIQNDNNRDNNNENEPLKENNTTHNNEIHQKIKPNKIKLPKRKYAIIHGYNGHNFSGNQK